MAAGGGLFSEGQALDVPSPIVATINLARHQDAAQEFVLLLESLIVDDGIGATISASRSEELLL